MFDVEFENVHLTGIACRRTELDIVIDNRLVPIPVDDPPFFEFSFDADCMDVGSQVYAVQRILYQGELLSCTQSVLATRQL
jgi:hypothetical protein